MLIPLVRRFSTHYAKREPGNSSYLDYATGSFVTYFPQHMKPSTLQRCFLGTYRKLYTHAHILKSVLRRDPYESVFGVRHGLSRRPTA